MAIRIILIKHGVCRVKFLDVGFKSWICGGFQTP